MHELAVRETVQFAGFTFNWQTLEMTWLAMAIVIFIAWLGTRNLKLVPTGWQNVLEMAVTGLEDQVQAMMGKGGLWLAPFIVSLFLFLLVSNWLGLIPTLASPTNDIDTTLGLALLVIVMVHVLGLYNKGGHYIAHFFQPFKIFVVINAVEEIAKPVTLACRLFGNILAGEILLHLVSEQLSIGLSLVPAVIWLAFSIFIGAVQAFIFSMLSMAYLGNAIKPSEEE